jgi:hypothetical protein
MENVNYSVERQTCSAKKQVIKVIRNMRLERLNCLKRRPFRNVILKIQFLEAALLMGGSSDFFTALRKVRT